MGYMASVPATIAGGTSEIQRNIIATQRPRSAEGVGACGHGNCISARHSRCEVLFKCPLPPSFEAAWRCYFGAMMNVPAGPSACWRGLKLGSNPIPTIPSADMRRLMPILSGRVKTTW